MVVRGDLSKAAIVASLLVGITFIGACGYLMFFCAIITDGRVGSALFSSVTKGAALSTAHGLKPISNRTGSAADIECHVVFSYGGAHICRCLDDCTAKIFGFVCEEDLESALFEGCLKEGIFFEDGVSNVGLEVDMCRDVGDCHFREEWVAAASI